MRSAPIAAAETAIDKPKRDSRKAEKIDQRLVGAARQLRDRWLEQVNADSSSMLSHGKYDVSDALGVSAERDPAVCPR
jgi:hypothetical protein